MNKKTLLSCVICVIDTQNRTNNETRVYSKQVMFFKQKYQLYLSMAGHLMYFILSCNS
jgi:hypothetical protein